MSDDEDQMHSEEQDDGPSEAQLAMQRRRGQATEGGEGDDEYAKELLEQNKIEREAMEAEIQELRERSERRKKERKEEEERMAEKRAEEEQKRKAEEEERRRKKDEEEATRREARAKKMAEFEKWKNPQKRNFVITKREDGEVSVETEDDDNPAKEKKSREQIEAEKKAILSQRIKPMDISGFDEAKLHEKAKELHKELYRLESEKYDLEKRYKEQQRDMMELAERARSVNKVGRGGLKRVQLGDEESDKIQEKFAGAPAKIVMYSQFERQKDKRAYGERVQLFTGPVYGFPAERIKPQRKVVWDDNTGLPTYTEDENAGGEEGEAPPPAEVAAEEEE